MKEDINAVDEKEFEVAEQQAEEDAAYGDIYTHILSKPFKYDGYTFEEFEFNWTKLTGKDSLAIEHEIEIMGKALIAPEFSGDYLIRMAARACTNTVELNGQRVPVSSDMLESLPLRDYNRIRRAARSFLIRQ